MVQYCMIALECICHMEANRNKNDVAVGTITIDIRIFEIHKMKFHLPCFSMHVFHACLYY